jgi:energy-coupling factor transport system ATP-binding protein
MGKTVVLVENLNSIYPSGVHALTNINLSIQENEFLGIIGQNGAGKSTLLKNIIGLLKPSSGRVVVLDSDTREIAVSELSTKVGFVLQNPDLQLFAQTIREEVEFGPKNIGVEGEELNARVEKALSIVGLQDHKEEFPLALSKGERAKVVIASVLVMEPDVIILDEPTCGQDHYGCIQIMDIAKKLHEDGKTIIVVTHNMALIADYAKRIVVFKEGSLFMDGTVSEVFSRPEDLIKTQIKPPHIVRVGLALKVELEHEEPILNETQMGDIILGRIGEKLR